MTTPTEPRAPSNTDIRTVFNRNQRLNLPTLPYPRPAFDMNDVSKLCYSRQPGFLRARVFQKQRDAAKRG